MPRTVSTLVMTLVLALLSSTPARSDGSSSYGGQAPVMANGSTAAVMDAQYEGAAYVPAPSVTALPAGQQGAVKPSPGLRSSMEAIKQPPPLSGTQPQAPATQPSQAATPAPSPSSGVPARSDSAPSAIERAMIEELVTARNTKPQAFHMGRIRQFGYSFFSNAQGEFAPLTDIPVGPDYLIGVGDRLVITAWGSLEGTFEQEVNRNGEIVIPKVGTIRVLGIPYGQLATRLHDHLASVYKDFRVNVNLGKLRMMKVYVVGEVKSPGDYTITSLSTLINALSAAGGPTTNGTLRAIQIKRNGQLVDTVDLYDFFLKGDKSRDIRLQSGDTIYVPVIGPVAGIAGNVRRPAIYELNGEKTLRDILKLAGGLIPTGYLQRVQVARILPHEKKTVSDFSINPLNSGSTLDSLTDGIAIQDMDLVKIFPISNTLRGYVRLDGYVLRPGDYALKPGMRIADLLPKDNRLAEYYAESAQLTRLHAPDQHPEVSFFNVDKALAGDPAHNLELHEFDVIRIFSRWEMEEMPRVRLSGEVQKPGEYRLFPNMTVRDLLLLGGNPKLTAYLKLAELNRIRKTGESVTSFPIRINIEEAMKGNSEHDLKLEPFDELSVRKIPNWSEETERYVTLKGEFVFPGTYAIFKGEHLSSVIERAGGFTDKAFLKGAKLTRVSVQELQQKRLDESIARAEQNIASKQSELASVSASKEELDAVKATLEGLRHNLDMLKGRKAEGRLVIRLKPPAELRKTHYDVEMMGGDTLEVPQHPNAVNVMGYVYNPTSMLPSEGETVGHYLNATGGPTGDADESEIYVIRADGTVESRQQHSFFSNFVTGGFLSSRVDDGDTIVVPQRIERTAWLRDIKDVTTILAQLAISAGTVFLGLR